MIKKEKLYFKFFFSQVFVLVFFFFCNGLRVVKIKNCAFSESELSSAEQSSEAAVVYPQCFHIYLLHEIMDSCFLICLVRWIRRSGFLKQNFRALISYRTSFLLLKRKGGKLSHFLEVCLWYTLQKYQGHEITTSQL